MEKVSVITPNFNGEAFIAATIESCLKQSYENLELIVVDDCSTDNSVSIIESFASKDQRVKLIKLEKNSGPAVARNAAIDKASGRFIAFLDGDDLWAPNKLERQISFMLENDYAFTHTSFSKMNESGEFLDVIASAPKVLTYRELLRSNRVGCLTAIFDTQKLGKIFMPNILKRQDYGLWLRILKSGTDVYGLDEVLASYRVRGSSVSSNKLDLIRYHWELFRMHEGLSFFSSAYYLVCNIVWRVLGAR